MTFRAAPVRPHPAPAHEAGFTLIEMLVVVALLAGTAMVGLALTADRGNQWRAEDSARRMGAIIDAAFGPRGPVWSGEVRLAGFVADNGRLPATLSELSDRDARIAAGLGAWAELAPRFDPQPDANGWNNGGETTLSAAGETLWKGLRRYLENGTGGAKYRDAWGNVAPDAGVDADNYGWGFEADGDGFTLVSLGADGEAGNPSAIEHGEDSVRETVADDWSLGLGGWQVTVYNAGAADIDCALGTGCPVGGALRASLLVFENTAAGGRWRRYSSDALSALPAGERALLSFPASGWPGGGLSAARVPQGEHLVLMVADSDGVAHNGGGEAPLEQGGRRLARHAVFHAGAARPALEFVLR